MTTQIELFINWTIIMYSLFLVLPYIDQIIDYVGKSITSIIKNFVKILIIANTSLIFLIWLVVLGLIIKESLNFYIHNNYQITLENLNNISEYIIKNIFSKKNI